MGDVEFHGDGLKRHTLPRSGKTLLIVKCTLSHYLILQMEFIEDLPKTAVGKVSRRELRNREWSIE